MTLQEESRLSYYQKIADISVLLAHLKTPLIPMLATFSKKISFISDKLGGRKDLLLSEKFSQT